MLRGGLLALALALGVLPLRPCFAQGSDIEKQQIEQLEPLEQARQWFHEGISLEAAKDWAGALAKFEKVARVKTTYQVRYHLARCKERLGRLTEALGDYELAAHEAARSNADDAEVIEADAASLRQRIPRIRIDLQNSPEGTSVYVNGVEIGAWSKPITVDPKPITVRAESREQTVTEKVHPVEGEVTEVLLVFEVAPPTQQPPEVEIAPQGRRFGLVPVALGATGIASLAASGVSWGVRQSTIGKINDLCGGTDCREADPEAARKFDRRGSTATAVGNVTLAIGVTSLAAAAFVHLVGEKKSSNSAKRGTFSMSGDVGRGTAILTFSYVQ